MSHLSRKVHMSLLKTFCADVFLLCAAGLGFALGVMLHQYSKRLENATMIQVEEKTIPSEAKPAIGYPKDNEPLIEAPSVEKPRYTQRVLPSNIITREVLDAVKFVESSNNPNRTSPKGARGLYQIMEGTWYDMTKQSYDLAYDARLNEQVAVDYFEWIEKTLRTWRHGEEPTLEMILAAWNGGIGRLKRNQYNVNAMPSETREFVRKVKAKL